jgi:succinate dehydrogenase / fumarate reductase, cytochrome b subunit
MSWARLYATYHRFSGSWAFILHRLAGLALIGYLFMHIFSLRGLQLRVEQQTGAVHPWTEYVAPYATGAWLFLEWGLFIVVLFHSFNGIRIAVVDLAGGSRYHKAMLWTLSAIAIVLFLGMGYLILRHVIPGI